MKYPLVSVVIATYNSERTIWRVLESIKKQSYPSKKIEIMVIDGGSADDTLKIAKQYSCRILKNPKVDQVFAKQIGYIKASGRYLMFLDSDEVLENSRSLELKVETFLKNQAVRVVISSGYKKPRAYSAINYYINEYGDPLSLFLYKISKDHLYFLKDLKRRYKIIYEDKNRSYFSFPKSDPPFIELTSMGVMIDLNYVRNNFPMILKTPALHTHLLYLINFLGDLFAVTKNDIIAHYSAGRLVVYLKKIKTRARSNIFKTEMGMAGLTGREDYQSPWLKIKKFFFVLYSLTLIFPFFDSLYLFLKTKRFVYFLHPLLCLYTISIIAFYFLVKSTKIKIRLSGYGT